jgi:RNA polymerase sigma-70 factor, ECF subfamily
VIDNDENLWQRARDGDQAAIIELYKRCYAPVFKYVYFRVGDVERAEDITAEVFVRMVDHLSETSFEQRPLLAWLYTIAHNLIIDAHRSHPDITEVAWDEEQDIGNTELTEKIVEFRLNQQELARALQELTEDQRTVIIHKFIARRSTAETAALLGKDEGSIKSLQFRALRALRRIIQKEDTHESES